MRRHLSYGSGSGSGWLTVPPSHAGSRSPSPSPGQPIRRRPAQPVTNAFAKGVLILVATWTFVLVSVLLILPIGAEETVSYLLYERQTGWPIRGYISSQILMSFVAIWIWAWLAWLGMKLLRHAPTKINAQHNNT